MSDLEQELVGALKDCIESLKGYRLNCRCEGGSNHPCDAEREASNLLNMLAATSKGDTP